MAGRVALSLVLGLACRAALAFPGLQTNTTDDSHSAQTSGASGVPCAHNGRRCITAATCVAGECVCPAGTFGRGQIECVPDGTQLCTVSGDPHVHAYDEAEADVALPCRYRLTRFVTAHRTAATPHADCSVEVYATNEYHDGRYYIRSVHVSIGTTDAGQQVHHTFEIMKFGTSEESVFDFLANRSSTQSLWGSATYATVQGVTVLPTFDHDNNFAVLDAPVCGTRIKFRPYDPARKFQRLLPGMSIMAPADAAFVPQYGHYPHSLCGDFDDTRDLYSDRAGAHGLTSTRLAVLYDLLAENAPQDDNPLAAQCTAAMDAFASSSDKAGDLEWCAPILTGKRRCVAEHVDPEPLNVFVSCLVLRQGGGDLNDCDNFMGAVNDCAVPMESFPSTCI